MSHMFNESASSMVSCGGGLVYSSMPSHTDNSAFRPISAQTGYPVQDRERLDVSALELRNLSLDAQPKGMYRSHSTSPLDQHQTLVPRTASGGLPHRTVNENTPPGTDNAGSTPAKSGSIVTVPKFPQIHTSAEKLPTADTPPTNPQPADSTAAATSTTTVVTTTTADTTTNTNTSQAGPTGQTVGTSQSPKMSPKETTSDPVAPSNEQKSEPKTIDTRKEDSLPASRSESPMPTSIPHTADPKNQQPVFNEDAALKAHIDTFERIMQDRAEEAKTDFSKFMLQLRMFVNLIMAASIRGISDVYLNPILPSFTKICSVEFIACNYNRSYYLQYEDEYTINQIALAYNNLRSNNDCNMKILRALCTDDVQQLTQLEYAILNQIKLARDFLLNVPSLPSKATAFTKNVEALIEDLSNLSITECGRPAFYLDRLTKINDDLQKLLDTHRVETLQQTYLTPVTTLASNFVAAPPASIKSKSRSGSPEPEYRQFNSIQQPQTRPLTVHSTTRPVGPNIQYEIQSGPSARAANTYVYQQPQQQYGAPTPYHQQYPSPPPKYASPEEGHRFMGAVTETLNTGTRQYRGRHRGAHGDLSVWEGYN